MDLFLQPYLFSLPLPRKNNGLPHSSSSGPLELPRRISPPSYPTVLHPKVRVNMAALGGHWRATGGSCGFPPTFPKVWVLKTPQSWRGGGLWEVPSVIPPPPRRRQASRGAVGSQPLLAFYHPCRVGLLPLRLRGSPIGPEGMTRTGEGSWRHFLMARASGTACLMKANLLQIKRLWRGGGNPSLLPSPPLSLAGSGTGIPVPGQILGGGALGIWRSRCACKWGRFGGPCWATALGGWMPTARGREGERVGRATCPPASGSLQIPADQLISWGGLARPAGRKPARHLTFHMDAVPPPKRTPVGCFPTGLLPPYPIKFGQLEFRKRDRTVGREPPLPQPAGPQEKRWRAN